MRNFRIYPWLAAIGLLAGVAWWATGDAELIISLPRAADLPCQPADVIVTWHGRLDGVPTAKLDGRRAVPLTLTPPGAPTSANGKITGEDAGSRTLTVDAVVFRSFGSVGNMGGLVNNSQTATRTFTIKPPTFVIFPSGTTDVRSGQILSATVTRGCTDASSELTVNLASSDTSVARVPNTIRILANQQVATFSATAQPLLTAAGPIRNTTNIKAKATINSSPIEATPSLSLRLVCASGSPQQEYSCCARCAQEPRLPDGKYALPPVYQAVQYGACSEGEASAQYTADWITDKAKKCNANTGPLPAVCDQSCG